jgi:hypothetical protein
MVTWKLFFFVILFNSLKWKIPHIKKQLSCEFSWVSSMQTSKKKKKDPKDGRRSSMHHCHFLFHKKMSCFQWVDIVLKWKHLASRWHWMLPMILKPSIMEWGANLKFNRILVFFWVHLLLHNTLEKIPKCICMLILWEWEGSFIKFIGFKSLPQVKSRHTNSPITCIIIYTCLDVMKKGRLTYWCASSANYTHTSHTINVV